MSSQCFIMNVSAAQNINTDTREAKPSVTEGKVMSYEEKSVGSTPFFKCEACPYMALAEDDIKFHLFTVHPELAKSNGLADNIQIQCPGCSSVFDAEESLRNHLRNHHKMGVRDVKKMVKSLIQIALKNSKLKKEDRKLDSPTEVRQEVADVKIPQLIEIVPDVVTVNNDNLPKGVAFITVDELQKMSTPNFEKVDPKEIIQEASINIVYTNEISSAYVNVNNIPTASPSSVLKMPSVAPDLISSIQPRVASLIESTNLTQPQTPQKPIDKETLAHNNPILLKPGRPPGSRSSKYGNVTAEAEIEKKFGKLCSMNDCHIRMKNEEKLAYHRKCHQNGTLQCAECGKVCTGVDPLHTHLWRMHDIDMELPTCEICGYKTYKRHRLYSIHMKCHGTDKQYTCNICSKSFKNGCQLTKHKVIHKRDKKKLTCTICLHEFTNARRLKEHVTTVHEKLKPYKCCYCDYTAARKEELKLHIRLHTGDKPYSCDQCDHRAADHNAMRRHKKVHAKESIYKCKYCPYTSIQSTSFSSHMIYKHPNINSNDVHRCPYCSFKSVSKDKYIVHLTTTHTDKEGIQLLIEITKGLKPNKPSWTIPSESEEKKPDEDLKSANEENQQPSPKTINAEPIEVYDCDSLSEGLPQDYSKDYILTNSTIEQANYSSQVTVRDLTSEHNNPDCVMSSESNEVLMQTHQYPQHHQLTNLNFNNSKPDLHGFLSNNVTIDGGLLQNNDINSLAVNNSPITNNMTNNIMNNFPIRLPLAPHISVRNNITLKPVDKISLPMNNIITPTQILPVPSSSNSPVNNSNEIEGAPRKKPKISVKSNLILKGPDQVDMFHSQQKLAFKRLEDNERFCLGSPVTFNNLITTQFMQQLQTEPQLSESPNNIMPYPPENMMGEAASTPEDSGMSDDSQMFTFNQQINVGTMPMLPPAQKIQTSDPSYIKLEATIKQNTQSPSLERMCDVNIMSDQPVSREYKASPSLEDIHKNIKNEVKSNIFYNMTLSSTGAIPSINIDQYLLDNMIGEQYSGHMDLPNVVLTEESDQQNDVIEIDDNSDDNKLLPRYDMNNFPLEPLYLMLNDIHSLENDMQLNGQSLEGPSNDMNRVNELSNTTQKENLNNLPIITENSNKEFSNFIQGKSDPMMNSRPTNKINVKNIELMKN